MNVVIASRLDSAHCLCFIQTRIFTLNKKPRFKHTTDTALVFPRHLNKQEKLL